MLGATSSVTELYNKCSGGYNMNRRTWVRVILALAFVSGGFIATLKLNQPITPIIGGSFVFFGGLGLIGALLLKLKIVAEGGAIWGQSAIGILLIGLGAIAMGLMNLYGDVLSGGVQLALGLLSLLFIAGLVIESRTKKARKT